MPHANGNFSPVDPSESTIFSFDFTPALGAGETIAGLLWSISNYVDSSSLDPTPAARLIGSPGLNGNVTSQMVGNCLAGVTYTLSATATTSFGQVRTVSAELPCVQIW